jgi:hypothetical protein
MWYLQQKAINLWRNDTTDKSSLGLPTSGNCVKVLIWEEINEIRFA